MTNRLDALKELESQRATLAAQVKELRDALGPLLTHAEYINSLIGTTHPFPEDQLGRADQALTSTEHPSSNAVRQIERGALESAAKVADGISKIDWDLDAKWMQGYRRAAEDAASAIRALAEGGE